MAKVLDQLIAAVSSKRSVFGHEITNIADAFMSFDRTGVGSLGVGELTDALRRLGVIIKRPAARKLIQQLDTDKSGRIEYEEFASALEARRQDVLNEKANGEEHRHRKRVITSGSQSRSASRPGTSMSNSSSKGNKSKGRAKRKNAERTRLRKIKDLLNKLNPNLAFQLIAKFRQDGGHRGDSEDSNMTFPDFFGHLHGRGISITDGHLVKKTMIIWRELDDDQSGCVSMAEFLALLDKLNHRGGASETEGASPGSGDDEDK